MYKNIPNEIKPTKTMETITYAIDFDSDFFLLLRERRSPSLVQMQDVALEVESNIITSYKIKGNSDRDRRKNRAEASTFDSPIVHSQVDVLTKLVKSIFTEIEKLKLEGRQPIEMLRTLKIEVISGHPTMFPKSFLEIPKTKREMIRGFKLLFKIIWLLMKKKRR
jgi:hypothetical protein